jgi:hypothetical protein
MQAKNVIDTARRMVGDEAGSDENWSFSDYCSALNDGLSELHRDYPEWYMDDEGGIATLTDVTAETDVLDVADGAKLALAHYLAYAFYDADDGDQRDRFRASNHYKQYVAILRGAA